MSIEYLVFSASLPVNLRALRQEVSVRVLKQNMHFISPIIPTFLLKDHLIALYGLNIMLSFNFHGCLRRRCRVSEITLLKCYSLLSENLVFQCLCHLIFFFGLEKCDFLNDLNLKATSSLYKQSFVCPICFQMLIKNWIYTTAALFVLPHTCSAL